MQLFKPKNQKNGPDLQNTDSFMAPHAVLNRPGKTDMPDLDEIAKIIQGIEGFNNLTQNEIFQLIDQLDIVGYKEGDIIIEQGAPGYSMHIILKGKVKVVFIDEKGQHHPLNRLNQGDIFGEMSILTGKPRSANVIAASDVITCVIDKQTLKELIGFHPNIARFITQIIRERIDQDHAMAIGPYILQDEIGHGSIALIYKGQCSLGRDIAVKMLRHDIAYRKKFRKIFFEEAKIIAQLRHPNIIRLYGIEEAYGTIFIIMEYLNGVDLKTYLRIRKKISLLEALHILHQIAEALRYAHAQGVIHRDVKPSNCIVTQEFGEIKVTLTDFGLAREKEIMEGEHKRRIAGTPLYISPEAAQGANVDYRADIYALGVIAYELIVGQVPFVASSVKELLKKHIQQPPPEIETHLPFGLKSFIEKALIKDPQKRISSWHEIFDFISLNQNLRHLEYFALRRISQFNQAGTSSLQLIKQAFREGEKLIRGAIMGHILIKAGQGQALTEDIEENCYDILKKYNLTDGEIENRINAIKVAIESGKPRNVLLLLGTSNSKPQDYIILSNLLIELDDDPDLCRCLSSGVGYFNLNTEYAGDFPVANPLQQIVLKVPSSYAIMPLTASSFEWISGTKGSGWQWQPRQADTRIAGCLQIFQQEEEYNDIFFLEKLKALQFLMAHTMMLANLDHHFPELTPGNAPLDKGHELTIPLRSHAHDKSSVLITGDQIFKRRPKKQFNGDRIDSQMLNVYMEIDGKRDLETIAQALHTDWKTVKRALSRLLQIRAVISIDEDHPIVGREFIAYLKHQLFLAMGPVSEVFWEESLAEMGLNVEQLSSKQTHELIEFIAGLIPRKEKKDVFQKTMAEKLEQYH